MLPFIYASQTHKGSKLSYEEIQKLWLHKNHWQSSGRHGWTPHFSYWTANIGMTGPQQWQPPQYPQFAAGIWQYCGVWKSGIKGGVKSGGGGTEKRGIEWGLMDVGFAPDCEFLSVKFDEPLVGTPSLGQTTSSFTSTSTTSFSFSSLITTSSFTFKGGKANFFCNSALEDLALKSMQWREVHTYHASHSSYTTYPSQLHALYFIHYLHCLGGGHHCQGFGFCCWGFPCIKLVAAWWQ